MPTIMCRGHQLHFSHSHALYTIGYLWLCRFIKRYYKMFERHKKLEAVRVSCDRLSKVLKCLNPGSSNNFLLLTNL